MKLSKNELESYLATNLAYSVRRYYVDAFFIDKIQQIGHGCRVLDLGGKKDNKRGYFHIGAIRPDLLVHYVNIDEKAKPDFLCSIYELEIASSSYDAVVLSEVLEHLDRPEQALAEAYRVLRPGGMLFICTPFLFHKHADPEDFARYTDSWYRLKLTMLGFSVVNVENQGCLWSVLALYCKLLVGVLNQAQIGYWAKLTGKTLFRWAFKILWRLEKVDFLVNHPIVRESTTGYGVVAEKTQVEKPL